MNYTVEIKPRCIKDLKGVPKPQIERILLGIEKMKVELAGDVKKLTNHTPEYRLRVGDYRILFEIENTNHIVIYRILPRSEAYKM